MSNVSGLLSCHGVKTQSRTNLIPSMNVFFSKALESLAGRESGEPQRVREQAHREMNALRDAFNKRIADLEQVSQKEYMEVGK